MSSTSSGRIRVDERNAEAPLASLAEPVAPPGSFYVRSHFDVPRLDPSVWRLRVGGAVKREVSFSLEDVRSLPARTVPVTLECAGNGRRHMVPVPSGTAWDLGAVSTAAFTGAPLRALLDAAGQGSDAVEVGFAGADGGEVVPGRSEAFQRSLPIDVARNDDTLVAWEMNGTPLAPEHGFPARLIVPGWYGMASVKWLANVEVLREPFRGWFQTTHYVYDDASPVTRARVRSLFAWPEDGMRVAAGANVVHGIAWSGNGEISRVRVCVSGESWIDARLGGPGGPHAATPWRAEISLSAGEHELCVRAADASGREQPLEPVHNRLGYGNNVVQRVRVIAEDAAPKSA